MSATFYPVTASTLAAFASVVYDSTTGALFVGTTRVFPRIGEDGAWSVGTAGAVTMSKAALDEVQGATRANADGSYETAAGTRVLVLTSAGACEPSGPPPPAP